FQYRGWNWGNAILLATALLVYLFTENARRAPSEERPLFVAQSYMAWCTLMAATWLIVPWMWWGGTVGAIAWLLHGGGVALNENHRKAQAQIAGLLCAARTIAVNIQSSGAVFGINQSILMGSVAAILLYGYGEMARRHPLTEQEQDLQRWLNAPAASL